MNKDPGQGKFCKIFYAGLLAVSLVLGGCNSGGGGSGSSGGGGAHTPATTIGVYNACSQTVWMQGLHTDPSAPGDALVTLAPGQQYDYTTQNGLNSLTVWPKFSCDSTGQNCLIGQSIQPCSSQGCQPPVDSKFEATVDSLGIHYDMTFVDGYTAPIQVLLYKGLSESNAGCSALSSANLAISSCPTTEDLSTPTSGWSSFAITNGISFGPYPSYSYGTTTVDLTSQNLAVINPATGNQIGCFAPYQKLIALKNWGGLYIGNNRAVGPPPDNSINQAFDDRVLVYSNPYNGCDLISAPGNAANCAAEKSTQHNTGGASLAPGFTNHLLAYCNGNPNSQYCSDAAAAVPPYSTTAPALMAALGPITSTKYVHYVDSNSDGYSWQFDDSKSLHNCNDLTTKMVVVISCEH